MVTVSAPQQQFVTACEQGDVKKMRKLLRAADINGVAHARSRTLITPLVAAAASGKPDALELVIQAGGSLKNFGGQAVNWALTKPKSLQVLASHGALDLPFQKYTPLAMEAMLGSVKNMKTLLDLGANMNALSVGRPVLHWAAQGSNAEAKVKLLMKYGADLNAKVGGTTVLVRLVKNAAPDAARLLVKLGADPKAALPFAKDAVMKAALKGKAAPKGAQASLRYDQVGE